MRLLRRLAMGRRRPSSSSATMRGCTMITPDRWLSDIKLADFKDEVRPLILKENAARLLGLR
jgi:hypothetical protein